jgi:hypothetical protein
MNENIELINNKKKWDSPFLQIIPMKDTKGGGANNNSEDEYSNPQGSL